MRIDWDGRYYVVTNEQIKQIVGWNSADSKIDWLTMLADIDQTFNDWDREIGKELEDYKTQIAHYRAGNPHSAATSKIEGYQQQIERLYEEIRSMNDAGALIPPGVSGAAAPPASEKKFSTAKRRFAQLYHPNNMQHTGIEKLVREQFFKEFWEELEKIERET